MGKKVKEFLHHFSEKMSYYESIMRYENTFKNLKVTEPMKTPADFLDKCDPYADDYNQELVNAVAGYAAQQVIQERIRIKHGIYLLYKNNDKPPVLGAIHELIDSL